MPQGRRNPIPELTEQEIERFWAKVDKTETCWNWTGALNTEDGYGRLTIRGRRYPAHRISWAIEYGPIDPVMLVLHKCDNRLCVRPDHFFQGRDVDNHQDKARKGRSRNGWQTGKRKAGASKHSARLTDDQLTEIVALYLGGMSQTAIARRYGCAQTTVSNVVTLRSRRTEQALASALETNDDREEAA